MSLTIVCSRWTSVSRPLQSKARAASPRHSATQPRRPNEMLRIVCAITLLAVLTSCCSQSYYIRSLDCDEYRAFEKMAAKETCEVLLDDGTKYLAKNVKIAEDTTRWYASKTGEEIRVSTQRIQNIAFVNRGHCRVRSRREVYLLSFPR